MSELEEAREIIERAIPWLERSARQAAGRATWSDDLKRAHGEIRALIADAKRAVGEE